MAAKAVNGLVNLSVGQVAGPLHQLSLLRRIAESRDLDGMLSGERAQFILELRIEPEDGDLGFSTALGDAERFLGFTPGSQRSRDQPSVLIHDVDPVLHEERSEAVEVFEKLLAFADALVLQRLEVDRATA